MSSDTRRLVFDFTGRDNGLSQTMNRVGQNAEGLHSKMGKLSGAIAGKLATAAKGGTLALGAMAGSAVVFGVKTAASMEQAQVAFTTMLGSASKAKAFLADLQKFAAATPFELPQLTRASQRLLAFGFSAKEVVPTLTAIGDAVAGLGGGADQIDQVTTAIGQMMAKGKIQSDELLQLTEAGIPALKILANGFGKSTGAMQDMVTKGMVPANKAIPLLLKGIENGTKGAAGQTTRFAGMMKAQSQTLSGMFSTLKDNVSQSLGNMITPFMPALKVGLSGAVSLTGKLGSAFQTKAVPALKAFGAQMKVGFKSGELSKASGFAQKLGAAFRVVADWSRKSLVPALQSLGRWIQDKLIPAGKQFYTSVLKGMLDGFKGLRKTVGDNQGSLKSLGSFLGKVADVVVKYVIPALGKFYGFYLKNLISTLGKVITVVATSWKVVSFLGKTVFSVGNQIVKTFLFMAGSVLKAADKAFGWMPGIGPKIKKANKEFEGFAKKVNASIASINPSKTVKIAVKAAGSWSVTGAAIGAGLGRFHGGPIPKVGAGASRSRDSVPAMLRVDEHVLTPEEVDGAGGHGAIFRMRKLMRAGKLKGFAAGGPVGVSAAVQAPASTAGMFAPMANGVTSMVNHMAKLLAKMNMGATGVVAAARRMIGYPYSWGGGGAGGPSYGIGRGAGTFGFDCSGLAEYAWWQGAHKRIGGVTDTQWANSRPISGPRPGALAFPHGPGVHVMIGSDRPGYVIQAPFTGSFVQEVPRTSGNWRWPFATGGPATRAMVKASAPASPWGHATYSPWGNAVVSPKPKAGGLKYGWTASVEAADAWQRVGGSSWIRQRDPLVDGRWGGPGRGSSRKLTPRDPWGKAVLSQWGKGTLSAAATQLVKASMAAGGSPIRGRKRGGPVYPGMSYLVGEERPEIFTPRTSGTIHPNGAGPGGTVNLTVNVNRPLGTPRQVADEVLSALRQAKKQGVNVVVT